MVKGTWPRNDGNDHEEKLGLEVESRCSGGSTEDDFPYSYLQVMWLQDHGDGARTSAQFTADDPPLAWSKKQDWGWTTLARS